MKVYWQMLLSSKGSPRLPDKRYPSDAGWDLYTSRRTVVQPGKTEDVHTDIAIAMPPGWLAMIKGRSSTTPQYGGIVLEGIIDQTYRGELFYLLYNPKKVPIEIPVHSRLSQLVFLPVPEIEWHQVLELPPSLRGKHGFGSTGK